jgi:hypothetical protein
MKLIKKLIVEEIKRKILEANLNPLSMPGYGDANPPEDNNSDIWIERKTEELYKKILSSPEAFYEAVTQQMFEREKEFNLKQYPEYKYEELQVGKGLEKFSEFLRKAITEEQWKTNKIVEIAYNILYDVVEKMAEKAWEKGEAFEDEY